MAEAKEVSHNSEHPPPFLEVICTSLGKARRFAPGTKAGFALALINNKIDAGAPLASYIEAAKEGRSQLVLALARSCSVMARDGGCRQLLIVKASSLSRTKRKVSEPTISFPFIGKILLAFVFIFLLGGIFTLALENLPRLMLFINSSL